MMMQRDPRRHRLVRKILCCAGALGLPAASLAFNPLVGDYSKEHPRDIRVMSYNHHEEFITNASADAEFSRILAAIQPDVICFQEMATGLSGATIATRLNSILPIAGGGTWRLQLGIAGGTRNVVASRYPLTLNRTDTFPASSTRGVTIALVNLPDAEYAGDLYMMGVHLKCCGSAGGSEDASRQQSADAITNWLADARGVARPAGNNITLATGTPIIVLGDFNLVGGPQPYNTLVTGNIQNNTSYGPDVKGDWDNTDMLDLLPADPFNGSLVTWQGSGSFPPSTLDHMFYTDSSTNIVHSFVFNTATMTPAARTAAGVLAGDTLAANSSDHLPIVADLRFAECTLDSDCADGEPCNGIELCVGGECVAGAPLDCDDQNPCTDDACTTSFGCVHADNTLPCNDGNACTVNDACAGGNCAGVTLVCDDALFCTGVESCAPLTGCVPGPNPCALGSWCDEDADACVPLGDGDFDIDGDVDLLDFGAFQQCFGPAPEPSCAPGNLVGTDAAIDGADLAAFITRLENP